MASERQASVSKVQGGHLHSLDELYAALRQDQYEVGLQLLRRFRDLTLLELPGGFTLVIACDSNASLGEKPNDYIRQPFSQTGRHAVKVPLIEVVASGAVPLVVVDTLCVEMEPSGRQIISGIAHELRRAGLLPELALTGSTEDNMPTTQTGVGITVIGLAQQQDLKLGTAQAGDALMVIGVPKSAPDRPYTEDDPEIISVSIARQLIHSPLVHELVPVGSKGCRYEVGELARHARLKATLHPHVQTDLVRTAGSATCAVAAVQADMVREVGAIAGIPWEEIGTLAAVPTQKME